MKRNVVEILYTDDCPFRKQTLKTIKEVIEELHISAVVRKTRITSDEEAKRYSFPGSPTVRINGIDVDPSAKEIAGFIGCRIYTYKGRSYEAPPKEMISAAFKRLMKD